MNKPLSYSELHARVKVLEDLCLDVYFKYHVSELAKHPRLRLTWEEGQRIWLSRRKVSSNIKKPTT